jgi:hypothetical protein
VQRMEVIHVLRHTNFASAVDGSSPHERQAGRLEQARKMLARLRQLDPALRVSNLSDRPGPYRRPEDVARYEEGLRRAGLPE